MSVFRVAVALVVAVVGRGLHERIGVGDGELHGRAVDVSGDVVGVVVVVVIAGVRVVDGDKRYAANPRRACAPGATGWVQHTGGVGVGVRV